MSMGWAERDPARLRLEMNLLAAAAHGRFVRVGGHVAFDEDLVAGGVQFGLRLVYPGAFPFEPPRAFLRFPALPVTSVVHRYQDGSLCLHGAHEWHPNQTGLWVRGRAIAWIHALCEYARSGVWPTLTH